jgi:hypothetical protein
VFKGKVPHCVIPNQGNTLSLVVLERRQCLQDNIRNRVENEHQRYKRAEDETDLAWEKFRYYKEQIRVPVYVVPFVFGIISNIVILIIIICNKNMRSETNMYILNLAISDLIMLTFLFALALDEWQSVKLSYLHRRIMAAFFIFFHRLSIGLSACSVALLNIHRYRLSVSPSQVRVSSQTSSRAAVANLIKVWIVATLFALPLTFLWIIDLIYESLNFTTYNKYVFSFEVFVFGVLPMCIIAFTYIKTARHHEDSSGFISEGSQHPQMSESKISAKIVFGLTVVFLISYVPYHVLITYNIFKSEELFSRPYKTLFLYEIQRFLLLINACLNPVSLFCTSRDFRKHLKRYLTCRCKTNSPPTDLDLTSIN